MSIISATISPVLERTITSTLSTGGGFNLSNFLSALSSGVAYNFSKTDTQFQEYQGPTPADDLSEAIGLKLDSRSWFDSLLSTVLSAEGPELLSNGDLSNGTTGWTETANSPTISVVASKLRITTTSSSTVQSRASYSFPCTVGKTYRLVASKDESTQTAGVLVADNADLNSAVYSSGLTTGQADYDVEFVATATTMYVGGSILGSAPGQTADFGPFSIKEQPERVENGDLSDGTTGWASTLNSPTLSVVSGRLRLTTTTASSVQSRASRSIPATVGSTIRFAASKQASAQAAGFLAAANANLNTAVYASGNVTGAVDAVGFFAATAMTMYVGPTILGTGLGQTVDTDDYSAREIPGLAALQPTSNFRPTRSATGAKFDGSDDRLVTAFALSGGADVFAFDYADIPASVASTQILFGAQDGSSNGAYLGVTTSGALRVKIGQTVVDSTGVDLRNGRHRLGFYTVGSTVNLFVDTAIVGSGTWTGSLPSTSWYLGAVNANGAASAFFAGSLWCPVAGRETISFGTANQITKELMNL